MRQFKCCKETKCKGHYNRKSVPLISYNWVLLNCFKSLLAVWRTAKYINCISSNWTCRWVFSAFFHVWNLLPLAFNLLIVHNRKSFTFLHDFFSVVDATKAIDETFMINSCHTSSSCNHYRQLLLNVTVLVRIYRQLLDKQALVWKSWLVWNFVIESTYNNQILRRQVDCCWERIKWIWCLCILHIPEIISNIVFSNFLR